MNGYDDLAFAYSGTRALFAKQFFGSLSDEANDILSAVGSAVHPNVPKWQKGDPARGILKMDSTDIPLKSGSAEPGTWLRENLEGGAGSGLNAMIPTHVEGHAAAIMHKWEAKTAELFINKPPCSTGGMCRYNLNKLLPPGSELKVNFLDDDGITVHQWLFKAGVEKWTEIF